MASLYVLIEMLPFILSALAFLIVCHGALKLIEWLSEPEEMDINRNLHARAVRVKREEKR